MIIQLEHNISESRLQKIKEQVINIGFNNNLVKTQYANYLVGIGNNDIDLRTTGSLEGIEDIHISYDLPLINPTVLFCNMI